MGSISNMVNLFSKWLVLHEFQPIPEKVLERLSHNVLLTVLIILWLVVLDENVISKGSHSPVHEDHDPNPPSS
jgi:hypothetical protein